MPCRAGVRAPWSGRMGGGVRARLSCRQARPPTLAQDHDDDVSLVACRKLNEVIGLKGVSRWGRDLEPLTPQFTGQGPAGGLLRGHRHENHPAAPRHFKQIVKSARANGTAGPTEDHTDDFLGCLNIPVRVSGLAVSLSMPAPGCPTWLAAVLPPLVLCPGMPQQLPILPGLGLGEHNAARGEGQLQEPLVSRHPELVTRVQ